jgi:hypothetical protein
VKVQTPLKSTSSLTLILFQKHPPAKSQEEVRVGIKKFQWKPPPWFLLTNGVGVGAEICGENTKLNSPFNNRLKTIWFG